METIADEQVARLIYGNIYRVATSKMTSQSHPYQQVSPRNDQNIGHPPHTMPTSSDPADLFLQEFPELAKLSREDLEEALRTPAYFDALFGTLPSVKAIYDEHESFLQRNVDITGKYSPEIDECVTEPSRSRKHWFTQRA